MNKKKYGLMGLFILLSLGMAQPMQAIGAIVPQIATKTEQNMDKEEFSRDEGEAEQYYAHGEYEKARKIFELLLQKQKALLGETNPDILMIMNNLALTYNAIGEHTKAIKLDQQVLALRKKVQGETNPDTLMSMNNLAVDYSDIGEYTKAIGLGQQVLVLRKKVLGETNPETLTSMSNLAVAYRGIGEYTKAIELGQQMLALRKKVLGETNPDTLVSMDDLAIAYSDIGEYTKAIGLGQQVLVLRKKVQGETNPDTLTSMSNLAVAYIGIGEYTKAIELDQQVLALRKKVLGETNPDTLVSMNDLAIAYSDIGEYTKAIGLDQQVLLLRKEVFGEKHPDTITSMNNLAEDYKAVGDYTKAIDLAQQVLVLRKEVFGEKHPNIFRSMNNLAEDYRAIGDYTKAIDLDQQVLGFSKEVLGEKHLDTFMSMSNLAVDYRAIGDYRKAIDLDQQVLVLRKAVWGEEHPDTLTSMSNLALDYGFQGQSSAAVPIYREMLIGYEALRNQQDSGRQSWFATVVSSYKRAALTYVQQGLVDEALVTAELCKARGLTEQYALRLADESGILTVEEGGGLKKLRQEIAAYTQKINESLNSDNANSDEQQTKRQNLEAERDKFLQKLQEYRCSLKEKYPKYKELSATKILGTKEGAALLPHDSIYVSFLQNDDQVIAFLLDRQGKIQPVDLGEISDLSDGCAVYRVLLAYPDIYTLQNTGQLIWRRTNGKYKISDIQPEQGAVMLTTNQELEELRKDLSATFGQRLLEPLAPYLSKHTTWIISPDDMLAYLPFETLTFEGKPAIETADISYIQSLSILRLLEKRQDMNEKETRKALFAMGAALYGSHSLKENIAGLQYLERGSHVQRGGIKDQPLSCLTWMDLPETGREIDHVAKLFPEGESSVYKQADATEEKLRSLNQSGNLAGYRYLLFATHGLFVPKTPELSAIVLGQTSNHAPDDGYITVSKWMGYDLRSDLVYLSACQTGLGREQDGEGVIGLPYALCIAGTQNTIMTLWEVNDKVASAFSTSFFTKLQKGMDQVSALSATKREFLQRDGGEYRHPSYWSAFLLYGI